MSNRGTEFRALDRIPVRDMWPEIERRANESPDSVHTRYVESGGRRLRRMTLAAGVLLSFAAVAYILLSAWLPASESGRVAGTGEESDQTRVAGEGEEAPRITKISDGYLLYEGDWQGLAWELVALPAQEDRPGCGDSDYVAAYRDEHGTGWLSCPDPFLAATTFSTLDVADEGVLLVGTVATDVASIQAQTDDDRTVDGVLIPMADTLESSVNAFVMEVPAPHAGRVVVMDAEGVVLQEEPLQVTIPTIPSTTTGDVLTGTQPYDDLLDLGWAAVQDEVRARLSDWSAHVGVSDMAPHELVAAMDTITEAINGRGDSEDWLRLRELMARRELLCVELPQEHIYRNGEYCS